MGRLEILLASCLLLGTTWVGDALAGTGAGTGGEILFKDLRGVLPAEVAETIYRDFYASFLTPSEDGREMLDEGGRATLFEATVEDLNRDGVNEIFVVGGNTYLSGYTGSSIWLFVRDAEGRYRQYLGFPAAAYEILPETNEGFSDLRFGGPGFCLAVWRWNGADYEYLRREGQCDG